MNAEIIAVGTELLIGQIANTNAQYISGKLAEAGINVYYHTVVGDNRSRMKEVITQGLNRSDIVVITGGLGPTKDDITKEVAAELMGVKLILHEKSHEKMKRVFEKLRKKMVDSNIRQVLVPEGSTVIQNNNGIAPGCIITHNNKTLVMLPGPPKEMKPLFDEFLKIYINGREGVIESKYIKIFGIGESSIEDRIMDMIDSQSNPTIAPYCGDGDVTLRVTARGGSKTEAEKLLEPVVGRIIDRFHSYIYSTEGESMEETVVKLLARKGKTLSTAESCTGGIIAAKLTNIPGSSEVFDRGVVTYSNQSKMDLLGVKSQTLEIHGAVSSETAGEMAEGIRRASGTDIGVSITGIAGPGGGSKEKPIGLVYIGLSDEKETKTWEFSFTGDRNRIRQMTAMTALNLVRLGLIENM